LVAFCFFFTSEQSFNLSKIENTDLMLIKNEIKVLNLTTTKNSSQSLIYDVTQVSVENQEEYSIDIQTKPRTERKSIFVQGFESIRMFPARGFNCYDPVKNQYVRQSVMLKAHLTCMKQVFNNLPREIYKKDKNVRFDEKYSGLFKRNENYEKVFGYNLYLEENIGKDSSKNKVKQGEQKLFKKYKETSKKYLRERLFENPCIIKSEKCTYLDKDDLVTIYYDEFTDLFAIVDSNKNCLLDFGIATEVKYAEIFAYKSSDSVKRQEICSKADMTPKDSKSVQSKELEIYQEPYMISADYAIAILESKYGSNFIAVENGEFEIQEWQAAKKLEHAGCFGIKLEDFGFSQDQAKEINDNKGGIVAYVRKGKTLPSLDLIRAYQNAIKKFCEDRNQSARNDESTFKGEPSITFYNSKTRQVVIYKRETNIFITAYKLAERSVDEYLAIGNIGSN
jgi:hypothetical protein